MSTAEPGPIINKNNTLGALLIGTTAAAALFGINVLQTYKYFQVNSDRNSFRALVGFLWILDAAHFALSSHTIYFYTVTNYFFPQALANPTDTFITTILLTIISNSIVRAFYGVRIWKLSNGNWILVSAIAILAIVYAGFALHFVVKGYLVLSWLGLERYSRETYVIYGAAAVLDAVIALSQCLFLQRSRTGIHRTDSLISVLMIYCVNTGLVSAILNLAILIANATMPENLIYVGIYLSSSKLYLCSLLAVLNARPALRDRSPEIITIPTWTTGTAAAGVLDAPPSQQSLNHSTVSLKKSKGSFHHRIPQIEADVEVTVDTRTD